MNRVLINKALFSHKYLKNIMLRLQNDIKTQGDLKTDAFERLHAASYLCVFIYGKFVHSSWSTETYLWGEERRFESRVTLIDKAVQICIYGSWNGTVASTHVFISVVHLLTLSDRFRVGFGSNTIEHTLIITVPRYLNSEPSQYVSGAT